MSLLRKCHGETFGMSGSRLRIAPVVPGTRAALAPLEARIRKARGEISLLYQVLLNSPPVAEGWEAMLTAIRNRTGIPPRVRELAILRVAVLNDAPYEFDMHVPHARAAGMSDAAIAAVRETPVSEAWDALDRQVIQLTDAMTRDIKVPDAVFDPLLTHFGPQQMLELTATIAAYNMVSRFLTVLRIE
jgi:4-carboxymuconolactone decarboxylase